MRRIGEMLKQIFGWSSPYVEAPPTVLTCEEDSLVKSSSRWKCFLCGSERLRPLMLLTRKGIPPGEAGHNIGYAHDAVFLCQGCGGGFAEKRRHDSFDHEDVFDQGVEYALDAESVARLREGLTLCPSPLAPECVCAAHKSLRACWAELPQLGWDSEVADIPRIEIKYSRDALTMQVRSGIWTQRYESGKKKARGELKDGRLTGPWVFWHENGKKKAQGRYENDLRQGKWIEWNERGEIWFEKSFKDGRTIPS